MESKINDAIQAAAAAMLQDMNRHSLEVILIPSQIPECAAKGGKVRAVVDQNPAWYRDFCADHLSQRTKPRRSFKVDTMIKRQHTKRALKEISGGDCSSAYAKRLLPYVLDYMNQDFESENGNMGKLTDLIYQGLWAARTNKGTRQKIQLNNGLVIHLKCERGFINIILARKDVFPSNMEINTVFNHWPETIEWFGSSEPGTTTWNGWMAYKFMMFDQPDERPIK